MVVSRAEGASWPGQRTPVLSGNLATWAAVLAAQRDGVERYLGGQWPPLVGDAFPDVQSIAVNSPW